MSFSFSVKKPTKHEAIAAAKVQMDDIVAGQSIHAKDAPAINAAIAASVKLLDDNDKRFVVKVDAHGSLSWIGDMNDSPAITSATFSVTASLVDP